MFNCYLNISLCIDCVIVLELSVLEHHDGESSGHLSFSPGPLQVVAAHTAHHQTHEQNLCISLT